MPSWMLELSKKEIVVHTLIIGLPITQIQETQSFTKRWMGSETKIGISVDTIFKIFVIWRVIKE